MGKPNDNSLNELNRIKIWKTVLRNMHETPLLKEETIAKELELAKTNADVKDVLEAIYLDEDRKSSFERFLNSEEFKTKKCEILRHVNDDLNAKICEVGAGPGFLAVGLAIHGFKNISILEPNQEWITGTGFISETAKKYGVYICNDLDSWYNSDELYDIIITNACVHHFENVSKIAAEIRCKIEADGKWLMFDEYFANSANDLYLALAVHSHVIRYGQYEWPYSASLYVELLNLVGYKLHEVIPTRYKNSYISRNVSGKVKFAGFVTVFTKVLLKTRFTVFVMKVEIFIDKCFGLKRSLRLFTLPQLLVFKLGNVNFPTLEK